MVGADRGDGEQLMRLIPLVFLLAACAQMNKTAYEVEGSRTFDASLCYWADDLISCAALFEGEG